MLSNSDRPAVPLDKRARSARDRRRAAAYEAKKGGARPVRVCELSGPIAHFRNGFLELVTRRHLACYCDTPIEELDARFYRESRWTGKYDAR